MAAGNAVIGALRAVLGIDTAQFETGLKSASSKLGGFGVAAAGAAAAAAAAFVAVGAAVGVALSRTIDDMDKLNKTSQKLGIPVEQLSALAYAADLSDVSFEQLSKGVGKLNKAMVEAAGKPMSDAANAFRALGVSATDSSGKMKSSEVVMGEIAGKFEGLKDGAGKTAVAMALFGKAGADLIPLLNSGKEGLAEMNAEAAQFGAIVSGTAAKQAEVFNDNLTRLGYAVKGVIVQTAERLLPILVDVSTKMVEAAKNSSALEVVVATLSFSMKGLITTGVLVSATMQALGDTLSIIWGGLARLIKGDVAGAFEHLKTKASDIATTATATMATLDATWKGSQSGAEGAAASTTKAAAAQKEFNFAAMAGKNAVDTFLDSQTKSIAARQAELLTDGMAAGAKERLRVVMEAYSIAAANGVVPSEALRAKISETANAAGLLGLQLGNLSLIGPGVTGQFGAMWLAIEATNQKLAEGGLKAQDNARLMQQSAELTAKFWTGTADSVAGSIGQMGQTFAKESKVMAGIAKAAGIVQATIAMFVAAAEAQKLGFPAGIAAAAVMLAKGAALVASIKGTSIGGFATGGSITVPGGVGGSDSVKAMVDLQPGEQLDIWRPGEGADPRGGAAGGQGGRQVIEVRGLAGQKLWTLETIRELVDGINAAQPYGAKIVMA